MGSQPRATEILPGGAQEKTTQACPCGVHGCRGGACFRHGTFWPLKRNSSPSDVDNFQDLNVLQIAGLFKRPWRNVFISAC